MNIGRIDNCLPKGGELILNNKETRQNILLTIEENKLKDSIRKQKLDYLVNTYLPNQSLEYLINLRDEINGTFTIQNQ